MKYETFMTKTVDGMNVLNKQIAADAQTLVDCDALDAFLNAMISIAAIAVTTAITNLKTNGGVPLLEAKIQVAMNLSAKINTAIAAIESGEIPVAEVHGAEVKADGDLAGMSIAGKA